MGAGDYRPPADRAPVRAPAAGAGPERPAFGTGDPVRVGPVGGLADVKGPGGEAAGAPAAGDPARRAAGLLPARTFRATGETDPGALTQADHATGPLRAGSGRRVRVSTAALASAKAGVRAFACAAAPPGLVTRVADQTPLRGTLKSWTCAPGR